jgi:hypothetical protein
MPIRDVQFSLDWIRGFATPEIDLATDVTADADGNVYTTGITRGALFGTPGVGAIDETFVAKHDAEGNLLWSDQIAGDTTAASVLTNDAGESYVLVYTQGRIPNADLSNVLTDEPDEIGIADLALIKYSPSGQREAAVQFGSSDLDSPTEMTFAPNGDLIVVGASAGPVTQNGVEGSRPDISVWRFTDTGEGLALNWATSIGAEIDSENAAGETDDRPSAVDIDPATGNIIVTGYTEGEYDNVSVEGGPAQPSPDHAGEGRLLNLVLSPGGELLQSRQYGFSNRDQVYGVLADGSGGYVIGGDGRPDGFLDSDGFLRRYSAEGDVAWTNTFDFTPDTGGQSQNIPELAKGPGDLFYAAGNDGSQDRTWIGAFDGDGTLVTGVRDVINENGFNQTPENGVPNGTIYDIYTRDNKIYIAGETDDLNPEIVAKEGGREGWVAQLSVTLNPDEEGFRFDYTSEEGRIEAVDAIYLGYYARPADPAGQAFWLDRLDTGLSDGQSGDASLVGIANSFAGEAESQGEYQLFARLFGETDGTSEPTRADYETFVNEVYDNLFNREPDTAGLEFWADRLETGTDVGEVILSIIQGAGELDDATLYNKLAVAEAYTDALQAAGTGAFDRETAVNLVGAVNEEPESVITGRGEVASAL